MKPINSVDKENLRILRCSKEFISLDKLIKVRINNLREESIESLRKEDTFFHAKTCADQIFIMVELLEELDIYNKEEDEESEKKT